MSLESIKFSPKSQKEKRKKKKEKKNQIRKTNEKLSLIYCCNCGI